MNVGDQVRVWKDVKGVPKGTLGTILKAEEESGYAEGQGDWWMEHLEVDFGQYGVHWVTDGEVAVVGDWRDQMYQREEATRAEREAAARKTVENMKEWFKKLAGG